MNYLLLFAIVLVCACAYYDHTLQSGRVSEVEQELEQQHDQFAKLQADNNQLTSQVADLQAKLNATKAPAAPAATPGQAVAPSASSLSSPAPGTTTPAAAALPASHNPQQMAQGVVIIQGDNAEGTGFLVKTAEGPFVVTNLHVLANNPHLKIQTAAGSELTITGVRGATDRDLAMLSIPDGAYTYLPLATDVSQVAHPGDADVTPGNSQGGNVVLSTPGNIVGIGPDRVEFNNPIYHGNSGGPVIHGPSGTVIAVVTEAMKVDMSSDLDKTSFASRNSAIASSIRYFGLRLDTVPKWEPYDLGRYENETAFLDNFDKQSRALDAYLNPPKGNVNSNASNGSSPDDNLYEHDDRIMTAHHNFRQQLDGGDTSSQIDALRELGFALDAIADRDFDAVKNPNNFYTFDQQRARDEASYRAALKKEIQEFCSDVSRIGDLPRTND